MAVAALLRVTWISWRVCVLKSEGCFVWGLRWRGSVVMVSADGTLYYRVRCPGEIQQLLMLLIVVREFDHFTVSRVVTLH